MLLLHHSAFLFPAFLLKPEFMPSLEYLIPAPDHHCAMVQGPVLEQILLNPAHHFVLLPADYIKRTRQSSKCPVIMLTSVTSTALNHHVLILLEDHI